jgi:FMN phosphatase YigB (HAD superfamily)
MQARDDMINTILFDLDGTLLPMDIKIFEKVYFGSLSRHFMDKHDLQSFIDLIWGATKAMVANTEHRTNEEVFMEAMKLSVHEQLDEYKARFNHFYQTDFDAVKQSVSKNEDILSAVKILKKKGYQLVIATNPMFPRLAIEKRISWAGLDIEDFSYVTSFEDNHYCKPQPKFYQEVLSEIGKSPFECLMVGNDTYEDLIAGKLNIATYLIEDHAIVRDHALTPTYQGTYKDFLSFVDALPKIN